jgi:hypothetical protein
MFGAYAFTYLSFSTHKQCTPSQLYATALLWFTYKPYTLAGIEPVSVVPQADAMGHFARPKTYSETKIPSVCPTIHKIHF